MSADLLLQWLSQALFVGIFLAVARQAVRRPLRKNVDSALLFGFAALAVAQAWLQQALRLTPSPVLIAIGGSLVMALPYLLLRLLDDIAGVPRAVLRLAEGGMAGAVAALFVLAPPLPLWLTALLVGYF